MLKQFNMNESNQCKRNGDAEISLCNKIFYFPRYFFWLCLFKPLEQHYTTFKYRTDNLAARAENNCPPIQVLVKIGAGKLIDGKVSSIF